MGKEGTFAILESLAKEINRPVQDCHMSDWNSAILYRGWFRKGIFTKQVTFSRGKNRVDVFASPYILNVLIRCPKHKLLKYLVSINSKDFVFMLKKLCPFTIGKGKFPVYISGYSNTDIDSLQDWLSAPQVSEEIDCLKLQKREGLQLMGNGVSLYCEPRPINDFMEMINCLCQLIENIPLVEETKPDLNKLPDEFHPLIPLIKKWAIQDDVLREEKLAKTSAKVKEKVYRTVSPMFDKINEYLDSFGDGALPEEAVLLSAFAETVDEMGGKKGE